MKNKALMYGPLLAMIGVASAQSPIDYYDDDKEYPSRSSEDLDDVATQAGNAAVGLNATRVNTRDVGDRLFRMRAGQPLHQTSTTTTTAPSAKGGKEPIVSTVNTPACWEVFGGLFYYTEDADQLYRFQVQGPGTAPNPINVLIGADTDLDIFGGHIGVEHRFNENWRGGLAIAGSRSELDTSINNFALANTEVDAFSIMPYITYYRDNAVFGADFWMDLLYGYTDLSYDIQRTFGAFTGVGSPDGSTHTLDFNTGLTFRGNRVAHGPYAGLRWIDGEVDSYTQNIIGIGPAGFFPSLDMESLASTLGYSISIPIALSNGTLIPQFRAAWEHEFEDDAGAVFGIPFADREEDIAVLGAGLGYYGNSGWNAVLDYEARIGEDLDGHYVGLKVGKEF